MAYRPAASVHGCAVIALPAWLAGAIVRLAGTLIDVGARELCRRGQGGEARRRIERAEAVAEERQRAKERLRAAREETDG